MTAPHLASVLRRIPRLSQRQALFHSSCGTLSLAPSLKIDPKSDRKDQGVDPLFFYCNKVSTPLPEKFSQLHTQSIQEYPGTADKTVSELQGQFQRLLMRMTRPQQVLELGCFMGYSAMAMADGMDPKGVIYTCEKDAKAAQLARDLFVREGYQSSSSSSSKARIELLEGDAKASLQTLADKHLQFDAVFLDADKGNYINYYDFILDHGMLSKHGYILADNVLFSGMVLHSPSSQRSQPLSPPPSPPASSGIKLKEEKAKAFLQRTANHMDAFNIHVRKDPRVEVVTLPVFDGLSVIMLKS